MDLGKFYDKNVKIEDINDNIIIGYVFDYDEGDEEDEDSEYFNVPYLLIEDIVVIKGKDYYDGCKSLFDENNIKKIEII